MVNLAKPTGKIGTLRRSASRATGVVAAAVKDSMQYRFAFLSASLGTSFSILIQVLFWSGVYRLNGVESIAGYSRNGMLSYIVIAQVIILTSHYMEDIERICRRILWLNFGKKVFDGTREQLASLVSNRKALEIQVRDPVSGGAWERYGEVVGQSSYAASFVVASEEVSTLSAWLMKDLKAVDISVHSLPLSDIVHELFRRSRP